MDFIPYFVKMFKMLYVLLIVIEKPLSFTPIISIFSDSNKTFRPKKAHKSGKRSELHSFAKATLGSGNMKEAVSLPADEDVNEWIAMNSISRVTYFQFLIQLYYFNA